MYLSKIEIIGFKSFAQRININFDSGVTAIVGPNGCGKTNIVDAIRWALGEQRYSTLRSDKMEDGIFNGTKSRKPLGLAEVSLTIENTKEILPTDYSEVTITRRVFRSGDSEYLLNKVPCRLKDIVDLFMDTGMGSDAYSVIELKMVETILSDKTDERRRLFEEAAGVTKYKFRRKAAIRKLEDVQQDLARVNDIVKEIQKTVNSLERQAKKAEQYNEVSGRLKALEIDLLEREYAYLHVKLKPLEEKYVIASTDKAKIDEILHDQEEEIDRLRVDLSEIENQLSEAQRSVAIKFNEIHHIEEKILVAQERRNSLKGNIARYEQEKSDLFYQQEALKTERQSLIDRQQKSILELDAAEKVFIQEKEEYHQLTKQVDVKQAEVVNLKDKVLTLAHQIVEKRGEQERVKARIDNLNGRIERSGEDLKKEIETLRKRGVELSHEIDRKLSKIEFLQRMLEGHEGFSAGTKYLLNNEVWKKKNLITVADIVHSDEKYRAAIETALAEMAHVLVVENIQDGYAAIEELKSLDIGKTSFICLQWVPKVFHLGRKEKSFPITWAADVVQCDPRYRPLINFLLDGVVVVESISSAKEVLLTLIGARCVTLDGQIVSSSGILRGGSQKTDEGGLLNKKSQIATLEKEIESLRTEMSKISSEHQAAQQKLDKLGLDADRKAVKVIEKETTTIEMRIAQLEFEKKRANDGIGRNTVEIKTLREEIKELQQHFESLGEEFKKLEEKKLVSEADANTSIHELETLEAQWNDKTKIVNELEIKVVTAQGDLRNLERDLARTDARQSEIDVTIDRRQEAIARAHDEINRLTTDISERLTSPRLMSSIQKARD
ncbi:MAG: AAA family ATPase [Ignavibacteriales bacterium]|nr:AAA family ATPase [Ignavibacteriales bacterium]